MKHITTDELKRMTDAEGLVLQGCGGNPDEWVSGINELLTKEGILLDGDTFKDVYVFEHDGLTNMLFNMEDVRLDIGKLAMWRLASHETFGGTWLSDYIPNRLGAERPEREPDHAGAGLGGEPEEKQHPISVNLVNPDGDYRGWWHGFPTTKEELQSTLKTIGMENSGEIIARHYATEGGYLGNRLPDVLTPDNLDELNHLAVKLEGLNEPQLEVFKAVMQSGRNCGSIKDIINVTENLDCFDLQPATSAEQYGIFLAEMERDEYAGSIEKLEKFRDPDLRELVKYIERLEASVDAESYGRARAESENGVFTDQGCLTEYGTFKEVYRGPEDIPAAHRVFALPEKAPLIKVENADLNALLLKMHALGGDHMSDAHYNLNTLADKRSAEYLLLMNERGIFLTEAAHAYRRGTTAFDAFMNASEDTRAFAVHITDVWNGPVRGDVVEVNLAEHQLDILKHSIHFTHVDATPKYGPDQTFTPEQWEAMDDIDRHMLQSWTRQFHTDDLRAVIVHLDDIRGGHAETGKAVEEDVLLSDINRRYMEKAENARPDMLRVTLPAAKDMLAHSDAPVYRLMPEGPKELAPLDAMPSRNGLWYQHYREFAVKKDDLAGIGKWADRTADAMVVKRQPERDAPDKTKPRGPEL